MNAVRTPFYRVLLETGGARNEARLIKTLYSPGVPRADIEGALCVEGGAPPSFLIGAAGLSGAVKTAAENCLLSGERAVNITVYVLDGTGAGVRFSPCAMEAAGRGRLKLTPLSGARRGTLGDGGFTVST